jgi:hypothetical protein
MANHAAERDDPAMKKLLPLSLALLAGLVFVVSSFAASNKTFTVSMNGKQEIPKGDPNGKGTAKLTFEPGKGKLCFSLSWTGIDKPVASHIHKGKKGVAGPVVIPIFAGTPKHKGCVPASKSLIGKIIKNPAGYYVNIHTAKFPGGALRGQL